MVFNRFVIIVYVMVFCQLKKGLCSINKMLLKSLITKVFKPFDINCYLP